MHTESDATRARVAEFNARREELLARHATEGSLKGSHRESAKVYREQAARYEAKRMVSVSIVPEQITFFSRVARLVRKLRAR